MSVGGPCWVSPIFLFVFQVWILSVFCMRSVCRWSRSGSFALFMTKFEESKSESVTGLVLWCTWHPGKAAAGNSSSAAQQRTSYHVVVVLFSTLCCCCSNKVPSVWQFSRMFVPAHQHCAPLRMPRTLVRFSTHCDTRLFLVYSMFYLSKIRRVDIE